MATDNSRLTEAQRLEQIFAGYFPLYDDATTHEGGERVFAGLVVRQICVDTRLNRRASCVDGPTKSEAASYLRDFLLLPNNLSIEETDEALRLLRTLAS